MGISKYFRIHRDGAEGVEKVSDPKEIAEEMNYDPRIVPENVYKESGIPPVTQTLIKGIRVD